MWHVLLLVVFVASSTVKLARGQRNGTGNTCVYPDSLECRRLPASCVECQYNMSCFIGEETTTTCSAPSYLDCKGERSWEQPHLCAFCYQLPEESYTCIRSTNCTVTRSPRSWYTTQCTVKPNVYCLGNRMFCKRLRCNWTSGYRWSTAMLLSVTLGGFGVDRFYLGYWRSALGKLFSFGGVGVWTIVDVLLIAIGYVMPADGSVYIF